LLVEFGVVQNGRGDTGTVDRRVRVKRADQDLDLRIDTLLLVGISADDGEGTNTLTVETLGNVSMRVSLQRFVVTLTMFLAKLWQSEMLWPSLMKWRMGKASWSVFPLAKPW
jgi:hypothetical protein